MVRADLLDCVDVFLRHARENIFPFGGVQIVMIGDLYQLPPILTGQEAEAFNRVYGSAHFFSAPVIQELLTDYPQDFVFLELQKIYRQSDAQFISLLNAIRTRTHNSQHLQLLNTRTFQELNFDRYPAHIILTTTNSLADEINSSNMQSLSDRSLVFTAAWSGEFDLKAAPTSESLVLKKNSRVMLLSNEPEGRWVNGTLGTILDFEILEQENDEVTAVIVKLDDGPQVNVTPYTWTAYRTTYNEEEAKLQTKPIGTYTQIPLKPAWAVTIHKSQGKTLERVIIDIGNGAFASGQIYVALSRATSLEGILLRRPIRHQDIRVDGQVSKFLLERLQVNSKLSNRIK